MRMTIALYLVIQEGCGFRSEDGLVLKGVESLAGSWAIK